LDVDRLTILVLILATFATYRLAILITRDLLCRPLRQRVADRYKPVVIPVYDDNGEQAVILNDATKEMEPAVTMRPHPAVEFVHCERCVSVWLAGFVMLGCHAVGVLDSWALVGLGWLAVAGAVALIVEVGG
jgi:hypothetical protein